MSVEVVGGTIRIIGNATVADAEPLLVALQGDPARHIDLGQAVHLHSAVIQILLALRPRAFRFLRLELLYVLLQAIDAGLALRGLARQHVALPLLRRLFALLDLLLVLLRALFDLIPSRQPLVHGRRCARARGGSDMRRRPRCHGRTLRCNRRPMEFRPRRHDMRSGSRWRCSKMWSWTRWR